MKGRKALRLLGGLTAETFLARHWQRKPLLVRGAWPGFRDPLTPDELAGLACERDIESRLVLECGGRRPWELIHGPQSPARLRKLPRTHWTLLVQSVDRHLPVVAALLEPFDFVPRWRLDDVMISFAPRFGSVGPHVDSYDVFLIQGRGRRRWRISTRDAPAFRPGLDLRILKRFRPEAEWVLEPGDMLYLPPGVAHHGVALEDCLTYSIGFRAPRLADLALRSSERLANTADREQLFADPGLRPPGHVGEIDRGALDRARSLMRAACERLIDSEVDALFGAVVTEPKRSLEAPGRRPSAASVLRRLRTGCALRQAPGHRVAFIRQGANVLLFADGHSFAVDKALARAAMLLADRRVVSPVDLGASARSKAFALLVVELLAVGALEW